MPVNSHWKSYSQALLNIASMDKELLAQYQINSAQLAQVIEAKLTGAAYLRYINEEINSSEDKINQLLANIRRTTEEVSLDWIQVGVISEDRTKEYKFSNTLNVNNQDELHITSHINLNSVPVNMVIPKIILPDGKEIIMNLIKTDDNKAVFETTVQTNLSGKIRFSLSSGIKEVMDNNQFINITDAEHLENNDSRLIVQIDFDKDGNMILYSPNLFKGLHISNNPAQRKMAVSA